MNLSNKKALSEMDEELQKLTQIIENEDFSQVSHKEEVKRRVLQSIREKEENKMKRISIFKKPAIAIASIAVATTLFAQTAVAKEIGYRVKEMFSIANGRINIAQEEVIERDNAVPENLQGQIFDSKGNEVTAFTDDLKEIYTKDGEKIAYIGNDENNELILVTEAQMEAEKAETTLIVKNIEERNNYTCFEVKVPEYLPEGYQFDHLEFYKDEEGKVVESKYINLYYTNETTGDFIFMQQRFSDEETGYTTGTEGKVERVQINGAEALIMDEAIIDWEADGVLYSINSRGGFSQEELIKMAESMK